MDNTRFMNMIAETAHRCVDRFWNMDLAGQLMADPTKSLFFTGNSAGIAVARGTDAYCEGAPKENSCIVVIDPEGNDPETSRSLKKAAENGQPTILITGKGQTANCIPADACIILEDTCITPEDSDEFGSSARYLASQIAVLALCCSWLVRQNRLSAERFHSIGKEIASYGDRLSKQAPALASKADEFAKRIQDKWQLDLVADKGTEAVSEYLRAQYCQEGGFLCCVNDCEEWCHVDFWCLKRTEIAAICACPQGSPSFSRFTETMSTVHRLERPYLIITDGPADAFYPETDICRMPVLSEGNWFLAALFFHLPAVMALFSLKELHLRRETNE